MKKEKDNKNIVIYTVNNNLDKIKYTKSKHKSNNDVVIFTEGKSDSEYLKTILSQNLKLFLNEKDKNISDLSKDIDVKYSTVRDWCNGKTYPRVDKIHILADYFNVSPSNLIEEKENVKIPVLGNIPAGIPNEAIEYIEDWEEIPKSWVTSDKQYFALKIKGNSMYPKYQDGDIVIFQRASNCDNGKNGAVMIDNCDVTFKKIIKTEAGIILQPINDKEFEPMFYSNKQILDLNIKIIGVPKEIRRQAD